MAAEPQAVNILFVVDRQQQWPFEIPGSSAIAARAYLTDPAYALQCYLIGINDNPNIDAGNEDQVLQGALYREVMGVFARRIAQHRGAPASAGMQ